MKALILVGGYGTRLRPLTLTCPKPIIEFCNKPMLIHQIESLSKINVDEVVLALSRCVDKTDVLEEELRKYEKELNIKITFSYESKAMGTAGPIALAKDHLRVGDWSPNDSFFVLNSDIICEFPLESFLEFHQNHSGEASILVTQVEEPSKFGVILYDDTTGKVNSFVEKPQEYVGNKINAGIYILNNSVIDKIPCRPTSIEKEIFPNLVQSSSLYCKDLEGFWMDVGQPKDYLKGTAYYLNYLSKSGYKMFKQEGTVGNVIAHENAKIHSGAVLGPNVVVGPEVEISDGVRVRNSTLLRGSKILSHSWLDSCIIGWDCVIGRWARMENLSVLGEDVQVDDGLYINGGLVLPHKSIANSIKEPQIIM